MRTTISLNDQLMAKLKRRAAESGTSVSRLVEQAVRLFMQSRPTARRKQHFELVTFGAGGRFSERDIDKSSSLLEADDVERFKPRH